MLYTIFELIPNGQHYVPWCVKSRESKSKAKTHQGIPVVTRVKQLKAKTKNANICLTYIVRQGRMKCVRCGIKGIGIYLI